jgi:hypothetical protein
MAVKRNIVRSERNWGCPGSTPFDSSKGPFPNGALAGSTRQGGALDLPGWKVLRGRTFEVRHGCRGLLKSEDQLPMSNSARKCPQTRSEADDAIKLPIRLDCQATMLQAISIGRGIPMLEPWIIDEIRRREEERRRGDRPQLELPVPDSDWPGQGDCGNGQGGEPPIERGVVIIGM